MIAHMHEVVATKAAIEAARRELDARPGLCGPYGSGRHGRGAGHRHRHRAFAQALDFLSIGTNDLIQYTLAIDRGDHDVASLYDPLHPAVLRLVANTINAGERAGKPVAVCGEMAGDSRMTRLLLGLGLTEFSMHPQRLLDVKREVRRAIQCLADQGGQRVEPRLAGGPGRPRTRLILFRRRLRLLLAQPSQ